MKNVLNYIACYLTLIVSSVLYFFVGFPNSTEAGINGFVVETKNIIIFEVIPLVIAILLTVLMYFIYLKRIKHNIIVLISFNFLNLFTSGFLLFAAIFLCLNTGWFLTADILLAVSPILLILSILVCVKSIIDMTKKNNLESQHSN